MNKKILVVDDEIKIIDVIKTYLENSGFEVITAMNGKDTIKLFEQHKPSLVVLDLMLPDIDGEEVCKIIREKSKAYIIILSAKSKEEHILYGLDSGADDYVRKPFSPRELLYRIKAYYRRFDNDVLDIIKVGNNIEISPSNFVVKHNNEIINLTKTEFNVLHTLALNQERVFSRELLIEQAIDNDYEGYDRTVDTYIKNIRKKLGKDIIKTVHGIGYKLGDFNNEN